MRVAATPKTEFKVQTCGPPLAVSTDFYGLGEACCRAEPDAPPMEMRYASPAIGAVISGVFDYRSQTGAGAGGPGAIVFGNAGEAFQCRHLDGAGNRRAVVALSAALMAEVASDCGYDAPTFGLAVLPPSRRAAPLYGALRRAAAGALREDEVLELVGMALRVARGAAPLPVTPPERARVLAVARLLDSAFDEPLSLDELAAAAGLSRYHFVRVFRAVVGDSPHQYLIGARLRAAANRLLDTAEPITAIALDVGFNDISHFNATFRRTFGAAPGAWRKAA
ncbi:AraC family transcriptional regulator [Phenylobacterium sp.]|uniref:helix-turn-helix domain-containing protein n=1 Tax=Phenylobacterium sp. TaxID=1871053 RepID=UPI002C84DA43|nr:AraC family transcriptional regulator [Phenylobacterium sp.]HLZ77241.1 AraC family transcriptional regulator [Phenylobacterium sp.]